jgi:hypothetical protein
LVTADTAGEVSSGYAMADSPSAARIVGNSNRVGTERDAGRLLDNGSHGINLECAGVPRTHIADNTSAVNRGDGVRDRLGRDALTSVVLEQLPLTVTPEGKA